MRVSRLTHLDSHQNLHLWPQVATVLLELAAQQKIGAIRLSRSSRWNATALGVRSLSTVLARRATRLGLRFPEASTGLDEATPLNSTRLREAIRRLADGGARTAELVTHLGQDPDPDRGRYVTRFRWAEELDAICDPDVGRAIEQAGFRLGSFGDLTSAHGCRSGVEPTIRSRSGVLSERQPVL